MARDFKSIRETAGKIGAITVLGAAIGTAIGAAMQNVSAGVAIGAVLGIAAGALVEYLARRKRAPRKY